MRKLKIGDLRNSLSAWAPCSLAKMWKVEKTTLQHNVFDASQAGVVWVDTGSNTWLLLCLPGAGAASVKTGGYGIELARATRLS